MACGTGPGTPGGGQRAGTVSIVARVRTALIAIGAALMAAAGCGDQTPEGSATATTAPPESTTSEPPGFATTTVSTPGGELGLLADVTADAAGKVDRVTFEFEGAIPGYRIGFVERPLIQDGSGDTIEVIGAAVLGVHFEPASGFDLSGEGRQVYRGPTNLDLATRIVVDVVRVGDFEANLDWAIGLDTQSVFRVVTATSPNRVIVEVEVPPAG